MTKPMAKNERTVRDLLNRGDVVTVVQGRLCIDPASGKPVPDHWLVDNQDRLIMEIVERTGLDAFTYESYSTGRYGKQQFPGVNLQFRCLASDKRPYAVFNAELNRARNTGAGQQGSALPKGQFRVSTNSSFYKFWVSTGERPPRRLSAFHDYMGNLTGIMFAGDCCDGEKLSKQTIQTVNLSHAQLLKAFSMGVLPDKRRTTSGQAPDNSRTRVPDKESQQTHTEQCIQADLTTGEINYGIRYQGSTVLRDSFTPIYTPVDLPKRPQEQSVDEWMEDYSNSDPF